MKKRFNIFCTLIFIAIAFCIVFSLYNGGCQAFRQGYHAGINGAAVDEHKIDDPYLFTPVHIIPKNEQVYTDSLYNNATGKYCKYTPERIYLSDKNLQSVGVLDIFQTCLAFMGCIFMFVCLFRFIYMIKRVNRGEIFTGGIVKDLRIIGISLIILFACTLGYDWMDYRILCSGFDFKDFEVNDCFEDCTFELITGLSLLLLAEIFKMGIKMKEDQELTI